MTRLRFWNFVPLLRKGFRNFEIGGHSNTLRASIIFQQLFILASRDVEDHDNAEKPHFF